ncbi:hypothetical protein [Parabacteroides sp. FAFU027]|uniref:hypothetical protein n=1 Tax=Parabacteroides sp. FAFU027 TaxID=2922715 RepID=UPI001FAE86EA|nr:hypothetical protein [Parabacteroides sp. FAFU027]
MRTKYLFATIAFIVALFIAGCGGDEKDEVLPPGAIALLSPSGTSTCIQGTTVIAGKTSSVSFSWKAASNAESYRIDITNLNTQTTTSQTVKSLSCNAILDINAYYSWSVKAINSGGSTSSDTLQFYLSGTPASKYAPNPADLTAPASGAVINANGAATVQVTFQWTGSDSDNDIAGYTFYLDNTDASTLVTSSLTSATTTQTLTSGKTYYWKVVTTDKAGNSSISTVSSFQVK